MSMRTIFTAAAIAAACIGASPATAACRDDLIKADQNFNRTRTELQGAASATGPAKCAAYRRHVASLKEVRGAFARCDTGTNKAQNAAATNAALADFTRQMNESCKK
ncbi:MAG: hypothetical protein QOF14_5401 [Hyphomicrobiales bacterium]|nr:hypothetical protein [Hyphomicrobiales bacterium]